MPPRTRTSPPSPLADSDPAGPPNPLADLATPPGWATVPPPAPSSTAPDPLPPEAELGERAPAAGSSSSATASSTPESPRLLASRGKAYAAIAKAGLQALGGWLNKLSAVHEDDLSFIPDDDDLADIPPPLGRLAARRLRVGAEVENLSDVEDLGMAAIGVVAWLAKGASSAWEARRELRRVREAIAQSEADAQ